MQSDGNFALHSRTDNTSLDWSSAGWSSSTGSNAGDSVTLQNNGDLVVFDSNSFVLFNSSSKSGVAPFFLVASDDIFGYIIDSLHNIIWITDEKYLWNIIWHDSMDADTSWIGFNSFNPTQSSSNCPKASTDTQCAVVRANNGDSYITKMTNISQYQNYRFHLQLDINGFDLENNDYCQVWYQYDNNGWIQYQNWADGIHTDQMIDIPTSASSNPDVLGIQLRVKGDSNNANDKCYFDNAILRGELLTSSPTMSPTPYTIAPTKYPTKSPTMHLYQTNRTATLTVYCDDFGNVSVSQNNGNTFEPIAYVFDAMDAVFATINISKHTIIRVDADDDQHSGGFISTVVYDGYTYSTINPISNSNWKVISALSGKTDAQYFIYHTQSWTTTDTNIANDAVWVWNGVNSDNIRFEFDFGNIIRTQSPTYDPTHDPTKHPTISPSITTDNPTSHPTLSPTFNPTQSPTIITQSPTFNPTQSPTFNPTNGPTLSPTINPTTLPTINPTLNPTLNPTKSPTTSPITSILIESTTNNAINTMNSEADFENNEKGIYESMTWFYVIIGCLLTVCFCVCCCVFLIRKLSRKRKQLYEETNIKVEITSVNSTDKTLNGTNHVSKSLDQNKQNIETLSNENNNFGENLTNLTSANNLLIDDVIDDMNDMVNHDDDDQVIIRVTKGDIDTDNIINTQENDDNDVEEDDNDSDDDILHQIEATKGGINNQNDDNMHANQTISGLEGNQNENIAIDEFIICDEDDENQQFHQTFGN